MTDKEQAYDGLAREHADNIVSMTEHPAYKSRRYVLQMAGATAMTVPLFATARAVAAPANKPASEPPAVGVKFGRDGHVLPLPGNTIICHLAQQGTESACFNALLDIYREAPTHAFMRKVTPTPPSSYHMTVFDIAAGSSRCAGLWPEDLARDAPMTACHRLITEKLRDFKMDCSLPLRMRVDLSEPDISHRPLRLRLLPVDDAENAKLRKLRDRLSEHLSVRGEDHVTYEFHITLGYLIRWLTPEENITFRTEMRRWRETVATRCPVIELGVPEFCTFDDMFAFQRQFYLS